MAKSPSRAPGSALVQQPPSLSNNHIMSTLAIAAPGPLPAFPREHHWDNIRTAPQLARLDTNNTLPSIRELLPSHLLSSQPQDGPSSSRSAPLTSPAASSHQQTSPSYVHSPQGQKRRRLSIEDEQEAERARRVPRLYQPADLGTSSAAYPPRGSPITASRSDAYYNDHQRPSPIETNGRPDLRSVAPTLAPPRHASDSRSQQHSPYRSEAVLHEPYHPRGPPSAHARNHSLEHRPSSYRGPATDEYGYSAYPPHAGRYASAPSSAHLYERTPFTTPPFSSSYYERYPHDMHAGSMGGETKQRKRRGNLPKETTDKLRAWFVAHLTHPYPTEDEKQELMRQTGLQMNQISNWFINARRRQLPNMINDAKAESDAMSGRSHQPQSDGSGYDRRARDPLNFSDGEGRSYDEDLRMRRSHRESI